MDRYWCPKPTSCFSFFYFCPHKSVNICPHLSNPCTYFKYLSVSHIINMLSIIVEYYFCVRSTHKPVITWTLWAPPVQKWKKNILIDGHVKTPAEFFDHCQNFYETFEVPAGCNTTVETSVSIYWVYSVSCASMQKLKNNLLQFFPTVQLKEQNKITTIWSFKIYQLLLKVNQSYAMWAVLRK